MYTSASISLAAMEMLVHLQAADVLAAYVVRAATFDASLVSAIDAADLPRRWRSSPAPLAVQGVGDDWVAGGRSAVLRVPSAVIPAEFNYLLNPAHPDFAPITLGPRRRFSFDPRLLKS